MSGATNYEYLDSISNESEIYNNVLHQTYGYGAWIDIPEDVATSFTIKDYSFSTSYKHPTIFEDIETGKTYDLTTPVCFLGDRDGYRKNSSVLSDGGTMEKKNLYGQKRIKKNGSP